MKLMTPLHGLPEFEDYMKEVASEREAVIADLCSDSVVGNERLTLATIGELRTYTNVLSLYTSRIAQERPTPVLEENLPNQ